MASKRGQGLSGFWDTTIPKEHIMRQLFPFLSQLKIRFQHGMVRWKSTHPAGNLTQKPTFAPHKLIRFFTKYHYILLCNLQGIHQDIFALFHNEDLLTAARWPDALWSEKTVFNNSFWRPTQVGTQVHRMVHRNIGWYTGWYTGT